MTSSAGQPPSMRDMSSEHEQRQQAATSRLHRSVPTGTRGRSDESWIEIASHPSASSLSSAGGEDVLGPGLRMPHALNQRRRTGLRAAGRAVYPNASSRQQSTEIESQEEYSESESESERVMSSSNEEGVVPSSTDPSSHLQAYSSASDDNASEKAFSGTDTAISRRTSASPEPTIFTPQPNAFSHPLVTRQQATGTSAPGSYFPLVTSPRNTPSVRAQVDRRTSAGSARSSHSPYNAISPTHHVDHDAALRASLNTLLSCAAAARGLPKSSTASTVRPTTIPRNTIDPSSIRLVHASAIPPYPPPSTRAAIEATPSPDEPSFNPTLPAQSRRRKNPQRAATATTATTSTSSDAEQAEVGQTTKRKDNPSKPQAAHRGSSKDRRAKKARRSGHNTAEAPLSDGLDLVSPTLLTWVVSAGVVVLFSALSFGAGYHLGKEHARAELGHWPTPTVKNETDALGSWLTGGDAAVASGRQGLRSGMRKLGEWGSVY